MKKKERENLRRFYAGFALAGLLANDRTLSHDGGIPDLSTDEGVWTLTSAAVKIADSLIEAEKAFDAQESKK